MGENKIAMLNVHIPKNSFFTLYAKGKIEYKQTVEYLGTFIRFDGVVILFYKYPHHRRAYIVRSSGELRNYPAVSLPNVKQQVGVIYRATGRRVDILRNVYWNLEQEGGEKVYTYGTLFWQKVGCLLDNFHNLKSAASKGNLILLNREYRRDYPCRAASPAGARGEHIGQEE
ncbi:MAG: hypothetical protein LBQ14_00065 [Treponema sp.]|jgi:hypothetical protein|nr:hypothetical protein [Treponema sp.]